MLDDLKRMVVFSHVVEMGSFSGAANRIGIAKSAVSKHVSLLEKSIGARLLNRSTRSLSLTDVGEAYFRSCSKLIQIIEDARNTTEALQDEPRGLLKVSCPASFGIDHIAPLLNKFVQQHEGLNSELLLDDAVVDMTQQGIDVAIRVGWLSDSSLRARKLKQTQMILCASPEYLKLNGRPETPEDLSAHQWVIFTQLPTPYHVSITKNNVQKKIQVKGKFKTNNGHAVRKLLLEGAGISTLTGFVVGEDVNNGKLIQLLPDYYLEEVGVYAVFQSQNLQQAKIRKFIDYLVKNI